MRKFFGSRTNLRKREVNSPYTADVEHQKCPLHLNTCSGEPFQNPPINNTIYKKREDGAYPFTQICHYTMKQRLRLKHNMWFAELIQKAKLAFLDYKYI